jgi:3-deoxy-manno-octulosonate cytidylyltransferase (CMP-KDO synthetase)
MGATRLPGKPLRTIAGVPMIERVYRGAVECRELDRVIVATDSPEIVDFCRGKSIPVHMTRADHASGTDRVWQVVEELGAEAAVNIQGDEPMVRGAMLSALIAALFSSSEVEVASLYTAAEPEEVPLPSVCKVVMDARQRALYFSRAAIPFPREGSPRYSKHLGYYAYSRQALASFHAWAPSELESVERLEQLRFLDHGVGIQMAETPFNTVGIDTAADLAQVELLFAANG